jgi:hypothetical protein
MAISLEEALRGRLDSEGKLPCAAAFVAVADLGVEPALVGEAADRMEIRLSRCQLGLFGYGPKAEGKHKIVEPADEVSSGLAQAIRDSASGGRLSCRAAWEIATALGIARMEVAAAAEFLEVKIGSCQLGAF